MWVGIICLGINSRTESQLDLLEEYDSSAATSLAVTQKMVTGNTVPLSLRTPCDVSCGQKEADENQCEQALLHPGREEALCDMSCDQMDGNEIQSSQEDGVSPNHKDGNESQYDQALFLPVKVEASCDMSCDQKEGNKGQSSLPDCGETLCDQVVEREQAFILRVPGQDVTSCDLKEKGHNKQALHIPKVEDISCGTSCGRKELNVEQIVQVLIPPGPMECKSKDANQVSGMEEVVIKLGRWMVGISCGREYNGQYDGISSILAMIVSGKLSQWK